MHRLQKKNSNWQKNVSNNNYDKKRIKNENRSAYKNLSVRKGSAEYCYWE